MSGLPVGYYELWPRSCAGAANNDPPVAIAASGGVQSATVTLKQTRSGG